MKLPGVLKIHSFAFYHTSFYKNSPDTNTLKIQDFKVSSKFLGVNFSKNDNFIVVENVVNKMGRN